MAERFKKGAPVRQRVKIIEGEVKDVAFDADSDTFRYLVSYVDETGEQHERWFAHDEIEAVEEA